eukprot:TRINITY_DN72394_c0_g1_i1.p1 TRINITY_DN72394_c0_g1~~TRINITY_DN72394_c0_g1_i1.p1  ORF type:complete len:572 (-),score=73.96 TRINITY_DN72394_c0_g1_i1:94-1809(-)
MGNFIRKLTCRSRRAAIPEKQCASQLGLPAVEDPARNQHTSRSRSRSRSRNRNRSDDNSIADGSCDLHSTGSHDFYKATFIAAAAQYSAQSKAFGSASSKCPSPFNLQSPVAAVAQESLPLPLPPRLLPTKSDLQGHAGPPTGSGLQPLDTPTGLMPKASPSGPLSASAVVIPPLPMLPPVVADQLPCKQLSPRIVPALHPIGCPQPFAINVTAKARPVIWHLPAAQSKAMMPMPSLGRSVPPPPPPPEPAKGCQEAKEVKEAKEAPWNPWPPQGQQTATDTVGRDTTGQQNGNEQRCELLPTPPRTAPPIRLLTKYAPRNKASAPSHSPGTASSDAAQDSAADNLAPCHSKSSAFTLETPPRPSSKALARPTASKRPRPPPTPPPHGSQEMAFGTEAGTEFCEGADDDTKRLKSGSRSIDSEQGGLAETLGRLRREVGTSQSSGIDGAVRECLVDDVHFTQNSCRSTFRNGAPLDSVIQGLNVGQLNPLTTDWLQLEVVRKFNHAEGKWKLYSNDNRRLYCLKEHQRYLQMPVVIKVRVYDWPPALDRFWGRFDQTSDGKTIHVRGHHRG